MRIARRGVKDKTKRGRVRWAVARPASWLLRFDRLELRHDRVEATLCSLTGMTDSGAKVLLIVVVPGGRWCGGVSACGFFRSGAVSGSGG